MNCTDSKDGSLLCNPRQDRGIFFFLSLVSRATVPTGWGRSSSSAAVRVKISRRRMTREKPATSRVRVPCFEHGVGVVSYKASYQETIGILLVPPVRVRQWKRRAPPHAVPYKSIWGKSQSARYTSFNSGEYPALGTTDNFMKQTWHHQGNNTGTVTICKTG